MNSKELATLGEDTLPVLEPFLSLLSAVIPGIGLISIPWKYLILQSDREERDRITFFLGELQYQVKLLQQDKVNMDFFSSPEAEHLILKAAKLSKKKKGETRVKALVACVVNAAQKESESISPEEVLQIIGDLSETEFNVLNGAYQLFDDRDNPPQDGTVHAMPKLLEWKELHEAFPELHPETLLAIFIRLQRTGLILRQQGFWGDNGDQFNFTQLLKEVASYISTSDQ
jgi:hypothetical protein